MLHQMRATIPKWPWLAAEHYKWLIFGAGAFAGFAMTEVVDIFAMLAVTAIFLFGAGVLVGEV